jgi:hypothetical protein
MTMLGIRLSLAGPVVASSRSDTGAAAQTLDYIPGGLLRGAAAEYLYDGLNSMDRRIVFHSGDVSFEDGNPLDASGAICLPIPLAFHVAKNSKMLNPGEQLSGAVVNLSSEGARTNSIQWEQLRGNYLSPTGSVVEVKKQRSQKTAVNPLTRRAANAQLFSLEAISPGQSFMARIKMSKEVTDDLRMKIKNVFDGKELRIGRSKWSEFGLVSANVVENPTDSWPSLPKEGLRTIWFISDAVVPDLPEGDLVAALGLKGRFRPELSFLRWRSHQPFNAHWRARGIERTTIVRGSILTITREVADDEVLRTGLGLDREAGFGAIVLDPELLSRKEPKFIARMTESNLEEKRDTESAVRFAVVPPGLCEWLNLRTTKATSLEEQRELVSTILAAILTSHETAGRMMGRETFLAGPSAQQWNAVRAVLENTRNAEVILEKLFGADGCARAGDDDWDTPTGLASSFHTQLKELVKSHDGPEGTRRLNLAIRDVVAWLRSKGGRE